MATGLDGVWIVEPVLQLDQRGAFGRIWSVDEFRQRGLATTVSQCSVSFNPRAGTLRGMHWQEEPYAETKLVRATAGAIFDVAVDVRRDSPSFGRWVGAELTAVNRRSLYVPRGFAHGFVTLAEDTEVVYQIDVPYVPHAARGFRWDDPRVGIAWPLTPVLISERDAGYSALRG